MIKNFIKNVLKALCYVALYFGMNLVATFIYAVGASFGIISQNPDLMTSEEGVAELIPIVTQATLDNAAGIAILTAALVFLILFLFFRARHKKLFAETWTRPVRPASLWPIIPLGVAMAVVIGYAISMIPWPQSAIDEYTAMYGMTASDGPMFLIASVLVAPFIEEILLRGLVFTRLCRAMPAAAAMILASLVFGVMHITLIWIVYALACGIVLTLVFMKYRSLYASMLLHCVFNIVGGYVLGFLVFPSPVYDLLLFAAAILLFAGMALYIRRIPREKIDVQPKTEIV
jgi:membrane protease YdiL (CAAX protease family)